MGTLETTELFSICRPDFCYSYQPQIIKNKNIIKRRIRKERKPNVSQFQMPYLYTLQQDLSATPIVAFGKRTLLEPSLRNLQPFFNLNYCRYLRHHPFLLLHRWVASCSLQHIGTFSLVFSLYGLSRFLQNNLHTNSK